MSAAEDVQIALPDETATAGLGKALATLLPLPSVVFLTGQLGAGKTTLTRAILHGLGHSGNVKSPTYTLVEPYALGSFSVFHFDLYRLADPEELEYLGIRDYFHERAICLIEWPERGAELLPSPDLTVRLQVVGTGRKAILMADKVELMNRLSTLAAEQALD